MNWKQYRENAFNALKQAETAMDEADAFVMKGETIPAEVEAKISTAHAAHDRFAALSKQAKSIEEAKADYSTGDNEAPTPHTGEQSKAAQSFTGWRTAGPNEGELTDEQIEVMSRRGYKNAFEAYLRKGGINGVGPTDAKNLESGRDTLGGFGVPPEISTELIRRIAVDSVFRQFARVSTTGSDRLLFTQVRYTTDDKFTSPIRMKWIGEKPASSSAHRVTDPTFGELGINVNTAMASILVTRNQMEDSKFDLISEITDLGSEAFSLGEDDAFLNGDGIGKPLGLLAQVDDTGYQGPRSVNSGTTTTPFMTYNGVINLEAALPPQYEPNGRFLANKNTYAYLRKLVDTTGQPLWPITYNTGALGVGGPNILGYQFSKSQFMPDAASGTFPMVLGDLRGYRILDRLGLSVEVMREIYSETNLTLVLMRKRVGGALLNPERIKVMKVA